MTDKIEITATDVETVSAGFDDPTVHPLVGVPDGTVVVSPHGNKEKIVYEYDEDDNFSGWHKEHLGVAE